MSSQDKNKINPEPVSQDFAPPEPLPLATKVKEKFVFNPKFRKANVCSRMMYHYANSVIIKANANGGKVNEDDLIDLTLKDNETQKNTDYFK